MSTSSEPIFVVPPRPVQQEQTQQKKKSYVTNYVAGQGKTLSDVSLPKIATGGIVPFNLGRDIIRDPDIMWYGNLKPINKSTVNQTVTTDSSGNQTITTTITNTITGYSIDIQFSTGLGPGQRLRSILLDNQVIWNGIVGPARTDIAIDNTIVKSVTYAGGNFDQAVDPYIQPLVPQTLPGYRGFAYVIIKGIDTSKLGNLAFEVDRYPDPLGLGAHNKVGDDINPMSAIAEIITSTWGGAGQDISKIGPTFATVAETLYTEGNGCSMVNRQSVSANNLIGVILDQIDGTLYENHVTGKLEVSIFRKGFDRANLVRIFDGDIKSIDQMSKQAWSSIPTNIKATYVDRNLTYKEIPLIARNLATSEKISKSLTEFSYPAVRDKTLAAKLLARAGAQSGSPVQQIQLTTNRKTAGLNPGDIFLITCSKYKYYSLPAVVVKRRTQPIDDNSVTLVANVILYPNNQVLFAPPSDGFFVPLNPAPHAPTSATLISCPCHLRRRWDNGNVPPGTGGVPTTDIVDYPSDQPFVFGKAYNSSQGSMGAFYNLSGVDTRFYAGPSFANPGVDFFYPIVGQLATAINKYDAWDGSQVDIHLNNLGPNTNDFGNIENGISLQLGPTAYVWIDDELFILRGGDPVSASINYALNTMSLTGCRRAIGDTVAQSHSVGAQVIAMSSSWISTMLSKLPFDFGTTPQLKFISGSYARNQFSYSSISSALVYTGYTASDRANHPLRPHNTKIDGARDATPHNLTRGATSVISWFRRPRSKLVSSTDYIQTDGDPGTPFLETNGSNGLVYRVFIEDGSNALWDCGTVNLLNSKTITVPAGAAASIGSLYVQTEFIGTSGFKTSLYQDKLPINLI